MQDTRTPARCALAGAVAWAAWAGAVRPAWVVCLLALSPLVLVPLGLGIALRPTSGSAVVGTGRLHAIGIVAAAFATWSCSLDPGRLAAALSVPWLGFGAALAATGIGRFLSRRRIDATIAVDVAFVLLAVGAGWLTISRAGLRPMGFSDTIVQLTAVHFHYAGFALPLVAFVAAARAGRGPAVPLWTCLGVPLTAIGITAGGDLEWVAATIMATGGLATSALLVQAARAEPRRIARSLLVAAGSALAGGMALALTWAWSMKFGWTLVDIDQMARWHGSLNALGFGFLGLLGLHLATPSTGSQGASILHAGRCMPATMTAIATSARDEQPTSPVGLLLQPTPAGYQRDEWTTDLSHGFDAGRDALRNWAGHRAAGIHLVDGTPEIAVGATVAFAMPVGPLSVSATCRIVAVTDEVDCYGFTYATLPHHPEDGEESFTVRRRPDGTVTYAVVAVWRPGAFVTRVLPPVARLLQRRAVQRYLAGVADASPTHVRRP